MVDVPSCDVYFSPGGLRLFGGLSVLTAADQLRFLQKTQLIVNLSEILLLLF